MNLKIMRLMIGLVALLTVKCFGQPALPAAPPFFAPIANPYSGSWLYYSTDAPSSLAFLGGVSSNAVGAVVVATNLAMRVVTNNSTFNPTFFALDGANVSGFTLTNITSGNTVQFQSLQGGGKKSWKFLDARGSFIQFSDWNGAFALGTTNGALTFLGDGTLTIKDGNMNPVIIPDANLSTNIATVIATIFNISSGTNSTVSTSTNSSGQRTFTINGLPLQVITNIATSINGYLNANNVNTNLLISGVSQELPYTNWITLKSFATNSVNLVYIWNGSVFTNALIGYTITNTAAQFRLLDTSHNILSFLAASSPIGQWTDNLMTGSGVSSYGRISDFSYQGNANGWLLTNLISAPLHLGTNNVYDSSTNLTTLDAISSTFSTSPNSVFGWSLNLTVSNSQGVVVDYSRPHYDIPSSEGYTNIPTVVNSDHAFFPYIISTIYSNCANCSVSYSINSIMVNNAYQQNQQIYGVALNASVVTNNSTFFFGSIGNGNASKNSASSASYALNSSVINNSVISLHEAYGSTVNDNTDIGIMLSDGANITNNFDAFVGEAHADPDGNTSDINNNISLSALCVPNANDNHQSAITNTLNLFVFGDSTMAGGQVRDEDSGGGVRTIKQYGDSFTAGGFGTTDFSYSRGRLSATNINAVVGGSFQGNGSGITNIPSVSLNYNAVAHTPAAVTLTGSVFNYTNTTPSPLECFFSGSVAYAVTKHNSAVFGSLAGDGYFILQPTNYLAITYTVAPTFFTNAW